MNVPPHPTTKVLGGPYVSCRWTEGRSDVPMTCEADLIIRELIQSHNCKLIFFCFDDNIIFIDHNMM